MQLQLDGLTGGWQTFQLPDAEVRLSRAFLPPSEADSIFERLLKEVPWRQEKIRFYGKEHNVPRLTQWYGDAGLTYTWSGIKMNPEPWSADTQWLRERVESRCGRRFNTVLLNLYRDGNDGVAWHADDEPELGPQPVIASVSLGAERDFILRHNDRDDMLKLPLPHGSLLVMAGDTQEHWKHALPKRKGVGRPRINLTFRHVG